MVVSKINEVRDQLHRLYQSFEMGEAFDTLPDQITDLKLSLVYAARRTKVVPRTEGAVEDLQALLKKVSVDLINDENEDENKVDDETLMLLLKNSGSLNEAIRDRGIFFAVSGLMNRGLLQDEQIWPALQYLTSDEVLYDHILEPENDAVFGRSMAVLLCSVFLVADQIHGRVLTREQYWSVIEKIACYILLEQDARGYVPNYGWAHAFTHVGNVLSAMADSQLTRAQKLFFMTSVMVAYQQSTQSFSFGEDQRIANATLEVATKEPFYAKYLVRIFQVWPQRTPTDPRVSGVDFWVKWYNRTHYFLNLMVVPDIPQVLVDFIKKLPEY